MRRRHVLGGLGALALASRTAVTAAEALLNGGPFSVAGLAAAVRHRILTAGEIAREILRRVERSSSLGAFIAPPGEAFVREAERIDRAVSRGAAMGPLAGVPVAIKDNIDVLGYPTTGGTPTLRDWRPPRDAPVVERLRAAGALIAGKTNLHELAGGGTTNNLSFGRTANPYRKEFVPGGSSGGSGAAVAARIVPAALGTDTAGSVRIPAAFCGVVGFRPSFGRVPVAGVVPFAHSRDAVGPLTTNVADAVLLDQALSGRRYPSFEAQLRGARIGVPRAVFLQNLTDDTASCFERVCAALKDAGATLVQADIPGLREKLDRVRIQTTGVEIRDDLKHYLDRGGSPIRFQAVLEGVADPFVRSYFASYLEPTPALWAAYHQVVTVDQPALVATYRDYFRTNRLGAILFPTTPNPAFVEVPGSADILVEGRRIPDGVWRNIQNTDLGSVVGAPGISLPAALNREGLPIGIELDALPGDDAALLNLARAVEQRLTPLPLPAFAAA